MLSSSSEVPQKSLQIKQDDKFFTRLLSKESSVANSSFRVYYGGASGAVPFMWESQPGTPKSAIHDATVPPLTPPPSYYFNSKRKPTQKNGRSNILRSIFPNLALRKAHVSPSPSPSLSSSSWSSCSSTPSSTPTKFSRGRRISSTSLSFDSQVEDVDPASGSPTSTLCFGSSRLRGSSSMVTMKKALSSIVGHGSGQGTV